MSGAAIKKRREDLGLEQEELALIFGCKGNSISRWEREASQCEFPGMLAWAFAGLEAHQANSMDGILSALDQQIQRLNLVRQQLAQPSAENLDKVAGEIIKQRNLDGILAQDGWETVELTIHSEFGQAALGQAILRTLQKMQFAHV